VLVELSRLAIQAAKTSLARALSPMRTTDTKDYPKGSEYTLPQRTKNMRYIVLARWSDRDTHYCYLDSVADLKQATDLVERCVLAGALDTRIETRTLPEKKGGNDAE
jgi:hypothetical protein